MPERSSPRQVTHEQDALELGERVAYAFFWENQTPVQVHGYTYSLSGDYVKGLGLLATDKRYQEARGHLMELVSQ